jgi:hypothetical protein
MRARQAMLETTNRLASLSFPLASSTWKNNIHCFCCYFVQAQFGEQKAREMKARQAMLEKEREQAAVNPNMIEVTVRAPLPVKEEKPKDPIPDVEWW